MIHRIERLGTELQLEPLRQREDPRDSQVHIPITGRRENVTPRAIAARRRYRKAGNIVEIHRTDDARDIPQLDFGFSADDIRPRLVREVDRTHAAAHTEWLTRHHGGDSG